MEVLRNCAGSPTCPVKVKSGRCPQHARQWERSRPNVDVRRWYSSPRWVGLRSHVMNEEPCCRQCLSEGLSVAGTQTDHIVPHRGDPSLFWNRANLQRLCDVHHAQKTRQGL